MKISFLIPGAQRSGTTVLSQLLRQHPEICQPAHCKEVHYFDSDIHFQGKPDYTMYHSFFQPGERHRIIGEATPVYMYWDPSPARIFDYNPGMKFVIMLRDPVERAFSAWSMETRHNRETVSFPEAVEKEPARREAARPMQLRRFSYLDRGFYSRQVRRLFDTFGKSSCLVLLNEELKNDPCGTLGRTFRFLGVDDTVVIIPPSSPADRNGAMEPALRAKLTGLFREDIRCLETLIGKDLSAWYS